LGDLRVQRARRQLIFRLAVVGETVGVAGVVAALSLVSDLARGHPPGEAMRACLLAAELGGLQPGRPVGGRGRRRARAPAHVPR